jgi:eukaryotic-like serine/threonine-protein kinase
VEPDGVIVFAPDNRRPLYRVTTSGSTPEPITALDSARRENSHRWPHFLPDGRHFLYTARSDVRENTGIFVGALDTNDRTWLVEAQSNAVYAAPGYLLFVREGTLLAQRFDAARLKLSGEPFALAGNVSQNSASAVASFSTSADGRAVAYLTGVEQTRQLVWFDRSGAKLGSAVAVGPFDQLQLAPDEQRAAVIKVDSDTGNRDIWLVDVTAGTLTRFTSHPANDWHPVWSPDGAQVAFASDRNGLSTVYRKGADGSGPEELIPTPRAGGHTFPDDWSQDGRLLAVHVSVPLKTLDVWVVPTDARNPYGLAQTEFQEQHPSFSPDGRWIAYVSDESGAHEVYVQALGKAGKQRVSTSGGIQPRWRRDGRELFFINAEQINGGRGAGRGRIRRLPACCSLRCLRPCHALELSIRRRRRRRTQSVAVSHAARWSFACNRVNRLGQALAAARGHCFHFVLHHRGTTATILSGPPLPPRIFIGRATTKLPVAGNRSS